MTVYIGDVHGKFREYYHLIKRLGPDVNSVQVGDFGIFGGEWSASENYWENLITSKNPNGYHRRIRGNHDNPNIFWNYSAAIKDGLVEDSKNGPIMHIGGALSYDRVYRKEGRTWWPEEELGHVELWDMTEEYEKVKPFRMVTHDCPDEVATRFFSIYPTEDPSRTRQAFQSMWEVHQPKEWVFGHWHQHRDQVINGTRFICLPELQTIKLEG